MEEEIDEFIGVKGIQIHEALEEMRKNEIKFKVGELKSKLPHMGRCVICTLRLPCKHFVSVGQMPRVPEPDLIPTYTSSTFNVTDYLPKLTPESHKRGFSVKYRGKTSVYNFDFNRRHTSLPNEKRLKQLETIESYREEKLHKEIEKINQSKEKEQKQRENEKILESRRKLRLQQQKQKIEEYKLQLAEKNSQIQEILKQESEKKRLEEDRHKKYMQDLKLRLTEYHDQKDLLKKISKQKVQELQDEILTHKPIRIKHLTNI